MSEYFVKAVSDGRLDQMIMIPAGTGPKKTSKEVVHDVGEPFDETVPGSEFVRIPLFGSAST